MATIGNCIITRSVIKIEKLSYECLNIEKYVPSTPSTSRNPGEPYALCLALALALCLGVSLVELG
jgi:hypothetical protein